MGAFAVWLAAAAWFSIASLAGGSATTRLCARRWCCLASEEKLDVHADPPLRTAPIAEDKDEATGDVTSDEGLSE